MALLQQGERGGLRFSERIPEFPRFQSDARSPAPSARAACSGMNACSVPRRRGLKGSLYVAERGEVGGKKTLGRRKRREGGVVLKGQRWCELRGPPPQISLYLSIYLLLKYMKRDLFTIFGKHTVFGLEEAVPSFSFYGF